jgi:hypothetical protein
MENSNMIRVLLVGDTPQLFFLCQKHLEKNGCKCDFAECECRACEILGKRQFDLVLSLHTRRGTSSPSLAVLLRGSQTTLFHALRLEVGCWWVPVLKLGEECFGAPALRPCEFANALDEVLKEIRAARVGKKRIRALRRGEARGVRAFGGGHRQSEINLREG